MFKRFGIAVGAVAAGGAALAISEGDRGADSERPLFTENIPGPPEGTGPIIVFLPGLGATTRYWKSRVAPLATRTRLLLVDLLGFGRSPKPWTTYTVEQHVAALRAVLEPIAASDPIILVGHSLGARLTVAYAARYPDHVLRLVLISLPYYGAGERAKGYIGRRGAEGWIMTHLIPAAIACLVSRRLLGWALPFLIRDVPREVAEDLNQMTWRSSTSTLWEVMYGYDLAEDLARMEDRIPLLCLTTPATRPTAPTTATTSGPVRPFTWPLTGDLCRCVPQRLDRGHHLLDGHLCGVVRHDRRPLLIAHVRFGDTREAGEHLASAQHASGARHALHRERDRLRRCGWLSGGLRRRPGPSRRDRRLRLRAGGRALL